MLFFYAAVIVAAHTTHRNSTGPHKHASPQTVQAGTIQAESSFFKLATYVAIAKTANNTSGVVVHVSASCSRPR